MLPKIIILILVSLAYASLDCNECVKQKQSFFLNGSGKLSCGKKEKKVLFTATSLTQCKLLQALAGKIISKSINFSAVCISFMSIRRWFVYE